MSTQTLTIMAVDDEPDALSALNRAITEAMPGTEVACFGWPDDALAYAQENQIDVAFLDIRMGGMHGLALAKRLKDIYGQTNIIFVTGYNDYGVEAISLRASGYILKPPDSKQILEEMGHLRNPIKAKEKGVRIQCFGNFGVFVDEKPLLFTQAKPKELLALLVHKHGVPLNNAEIAAVLWENRDDNYSLQSQTRKVQAKLNKILNDAGVGEIICKARNSMAVDLSKFSCDYYDYLKGEPHAVNSYFGEYLSEYSWAEFTAASLGGER